MITKNKLKEIVKLKQKKYRIKTGKVIVEGKRLIEHLMMCNIPILEIYFINDVETHIYPKYRKYTLYKLDIDQMGKITSTQNPPPIAALVEMKTIPILKNNLMLYLDNIREPGNLGTIIRTAAAFNIDGIVLSPECCEIFNPKVIRASLGTVFTHPLEIHDQNWLLKQKAVIVSAVLQDAVSVEEFKKPTDNIILVVGSEAEGISQKILKNSPLKIKIPMAGNIESLNVAVATAILLYKLSNDKI